MRILLGICLAGALVQTGCASICDEVADEAEAGGCAVGVLPPGDDESTDELTDCSGAREAKAQCLLDLTENVCAITEEEAEDLAACFEAAQNTPEE